MLNALRSRRIITITLLAILIVVAIAICVFAFIREFTPDFRTIIDEKCEYYSVDKYLVYALIKTESGYDTNAISHKGAVGLMQILPSTASWLTGENITAQDLVDPRVNIDIGVMLLARLNKKYTDFRHVLAAYNAGSGKVEEWIRAEVDFDNLPYKETKNYIKKVNAFKSIYEFVQR